MRIDEVRRLLEASGQGAIADDPIFGGDLDDAMLEHLVHEIAHGLELGFHAFDVETPNAVSRILDGAGSPERHEARVLAATWLAWPHLGLSFDMEALFDVGRDQGVAPQMLLHELARPKTRALAEATVAETLRLCGPNTCAAAFPPAPTPAIERA